MSKGSHCQRNGLSSGQQVAKLYQEFGYSTPPFVGAATVSLASYLQRNQIPKSLVLQRRMDLKIRVS